MPPTWLLRHPAALVLVGSLAAMDLSLRVLLRDRAPGNPRKQAGRRSTRK